MLVWKSVFVAAWVHTAVYTVSYAVHCFKKSDVRRGLNMLFCTAAGSVLCGVYILR